MKKSRLLATVTASLLLGVGAASAQSMNAQQPERAPAAQQNAPAEKVAPSMKAGERKGPETTGQSTQESSPGASGGSRATQEMKQNSEKSPGTTGQAPGNASPDTQRSGTPGDKSPNAKTRSDEKGGAGMNRSEERSGSSQMNRSQTENSRSTTTGQGAAAGSAKLSTEQRTKITTVIRQHKVEPTRLNVSVRVGTRIPASVHFYPLPTEVVDIYPEWRGFDYILVGDQIVVVDPGTHEIVAVLDA
ncbi:MAG TPA: DUF1236 domain-containing protein [Pseudolabrys sp.]